MFSRVSSPSTSGRKSETKSTTYRDRGSDASSALSISSRRVVYATARALMKSARSVRTPE